MNTDYNDLTNNVLSNTNDEPLCQIISEIKSKYQNTDLSVFLIRLSANYDHLSTLFEQLYGAQNDFQITFSCLNQALAEMYIERPASLKKLDLEREQNKDWLMSPNWVSTMLYVDRFNKDLKGFKKKISYLEELGINYVHLMPLLKMRQGENDGGYAVSDYRKVEEQFGSMQDIRDISRIFRKKNMLLELDLVLNHTSDDHEWVKRAIAGEKDYQEMYYLYDDRTIPDLFEETLLEVFPETAPGNFTYNEKIDKWVLTTFNHYQWDLNYTNPRVFIEMTKILLNLANQGIDILRLDAVAYMWKRLGTTGTNLDEAHLILQLLKCCSKIVSPGVIFKAEAIVQPKEIIKYLGNGTADECDIAYNASFMVYLWDAMATQNKRILEEGLKNTPRLSAGTTWINYIRCHDDIGLGYADEDICNVGFTPYDHRQFIISYYVGEFEGSPAKGQRFMYNPKTHDARISGSTSSLLGLETALENNNTALIDEVLARHRLMHSLIMSFGGIPLIYYGDEIATLNDYCYLNDPEKHSDNRWLNRPIIDWKHAAKRNQKGTIEHRTFHDLKRMIEIRKRLPEFHNENDYQLIENENPHIFTFVREHQGHKTLVVNNLSGEKQYLDVSVVECAGFGQCVYDLFQQQTLDSKDGKYVLQPFEFCWLKHKTVAKS